MRKVQIVLFVLLFLAPLSAGTFAMQAPVNANMTVTVLVKGAFNLSVNTDSFDFASLRPGQTGEITRADGVMVTGTSSGGNPWYLNVSAEKPLSSGNDTIPNEAFTWYGSSEGKGEWRGTDEQNFSGPVHVAYVSSADESDNATKVTNDFKFKLHVPEDTKPGAYTTTVMFTMTE